MNSKSSTSSSTSKPDGKSPVDLSRLTAADHRYLFLWCLRLTRHQEDAEDLMQQTFIRALKSHYRAECKPMTWLCFIARTEFLQGVRARQSRISIMSWEDLADGANIRFVDPAESALNKLLREERTAEAREQVEKLPFCMRSTILLQYFADLDLKQVARQTGRTIGAVKSYAHRGKKRLEARFEAIGMR